MGWTEAQGRNFRKEEAERFYEFNPNPDFEEGEQVEDEVLQEMRDSTVGMEWIVRHNDHNNKIPSWTRGFFVERIPKTIKGYTVLRAHLQHKKTTSSRTV